MIALADYQAGIARYAVDRALVQRSLAVCEPLVVEGLAVYAQRYLWRGELPVYPVMTTPQQNGGWGHLMPVWFKPQERPIPVNVLSNWTVFSLVYGESFGPSPEAEQLRRQVFTIENIVRVVIGTNLQLPFLPSTQGEGCFFRNGMLPFLLSILWLEDDTRRAWLRLHELGARHFVERQGLAAVEDPIAVLTDLEHAIFNRLERNEVTTDEAVAVFLNDDGVHDLSGGPSLLSLYRAMFGAIDLGITALAKTYQPKSLADWRDWILTEITMPYRMPDYGIEAIKSFINT